ncbi:MAG: helix-turn-helix domain-containing protein [Desulfurococcales archaeon]|nr:helix-turn-helix domain-containing protein [Desulfurococcales archaeon]
MKKRSPSDIREIRERRDRIVYPPFQGSSLTLLMKAGREGRLELVEPLSPFLNAVSDISITRDGLTLRLVIAPLPASWGDQVFRDWRGVVARAVEQVGALGALTHMEVEPGEAIIYRVEVENPLVNMDKAAVAISRIRGVTGLEPIESPEAARVLLETVEGSRGSPRNSMLHEALAGIASLALIGLADSKKEALCPPGHFTLSILEEALDAPKATVYRLLQDLVRLKYVVQVKRGACRGYALNVKYEPVLGDLMLVAVEAGPEVVSAVLQAVWPYGKEDSVLKRRGVHRLV